LAFAIGKTANASLLGRDNLGGVGGQLALLPSATNDWVEGAMAAYTTSSSTYVALNAPGAACPAGADLSTVRVVAGSPPRLEAGWCATEGGHGSPIATATSVGADGVATDVVVWGIGTSHQGTPGNGVLTAFDGDTGAVLVRSGAVLTDVEHWLSPIVVNGRMYVAGDHQVHAFDLGGAARAADAGPTLATADAGVPAACMLTVSNTQIDRCAAFGLSCQGNPQQGELGTCQTPLEGQRCTPASGCAAGLTCLSGDGGAGSARCVATCSAATACASLGEGCVLSAPDAGTCSSTTCSDPFGACGHDAGTCFPLYGDNGAPSAFCERGGSVATGAVCSSDGTGPASSLCAPGEFCATVNGSACMTLCNALAAAGYAADAGPGCPAGLVCVPLFGTTSPAGVCAQPCGGDAGTGCSGSFTCEEWNGGTGAKACFP
jgi:hypothetical protein